MLKSQRVVVAPEWFTTSNEWINTPKPLTLVGLRGKVILLHAFQMLCPGCITRALPQAQRVADTFAEEEDAFAVVGLHTVFEHHAAMQPHALRAFVHEFRLSFPIGIDVAGADGDPTPKTMRAYGMRGTPTTILIDAEGNIRKHVFGAHEDLVLGSDIRALLDEAQSKPTTVRASTSKKRAAPENGCDDESCALAVPT